MICIFEKFEHSFDIKTINRDKRIIRGVASLEEVDRDKEIVAIDAIDRSLETYKQNPIVRYKHKEAIGRAIPEETHIDRVNKAFIVTAMITDKTQTGKEVWNLIDEGIIKSFSIGGKVLEKESIKEGGRDITKITNMELYEVSVVDIPSNRKSFFEVIAKSIDREVPDDIYGELAKEKMRDEIARELFNKPYDQLSEDQKKKVHQEALKRRGGKPGEGRDKDTEKAKDDRPPKEWFDRCVRKVRAAGGAEDPEAVCAALWRKKKKKEIEIEEKEIDDYLIEKKVVKRGNKWCIIHCTGPKKGQAIKCFPTKAQADKMHAAIQANKSYLPVGDMVNKTHDSKNKEEEEQCQKKKLKKKKQPKKKLPKKNLKQSLRKNLLKKLQKS